MYFIVKGFETTEVNNEQISNSKEQQISKKRGWKNRY